MALDDQYFISPYQVMRPEYIRFFINGAEVKVLVNSLSIDDAIGERSTASFTVKTDTSVHFEQGQLVEIFGEDKGILYAGVIDKPTEKRIPGQDILMHNIQCKDQHYLADKRILAKAYEQQLAGTIIKNMIFEKLAEEGVTEGIIQDGPLVEEAVFNYVPVTRAIEAIAEKAGFIWYIDFDRKLYFVERSTFTAPWIVTGADIFHDPTVEHGNPKYRNSQYIKGGTDITDPQTEEFKGDGKRTAFTTGFKLAKVPTIRLNGQTQTVGIRGLDNGKQWYWSKGENTISQDTNATPIKDTDILSVTYQGEFSIVVISRNQDEITLRKNLEMNSGLNEDVEDEPQTTNREAAFQSASAKLKKYGVIGRRVKFRTRRRGLEAGQLAIINLPEHGLNNAEMLIESVSISDEAGMLFYEVSAVEGPEQGSWTRMFELMATRGEAFVIRENINEEEVLITLASFSKTWTAAETPNIFKEVYASNTLFPSTSLFPMFDFADRVKSVILYDSQGKELLRKVLTKQNGAETGSITSLSYIAPFEAIGQLSKVAWFGGMRGNIKVDEQPYNKTKTDMEAIQVEKIDTRSFAPATGTKKITPAYMQDLDDRVAALLAGSQ
ncbi:hypothetical protein J31TS4_19140 [Paenibacillus sp. J31TS4]|uniref:hypothetical protein n=1 Tax=Paenibacillus sp. J31TS4 TaxID=2807195 RepID=UPI001B161BEE|nr:hypothetical protein [Paenibacillus sp. J31TS4]GIP38634.1 hypothetical protein J31TS4_19140 [Paenibacillus sp. J31TS4]